MATSPPSRPVRRRRLRALATVVGLALLVPAGAATAPGALAAPGAASVAPSVAADAEPVRVMALGDSITGSPGCWRALLHRDLTAAGHRVDMVGTLPPQGCGIAHDGDNEGHGGALVTNVAASGEAAAWFAATRPQVVLMHFATNDVWSARTPQQVLDAWTTLVRQMRAVDPHVVVVAAQIIPVAPPSCAQCPARTEALNAEVPAWAAATSTPGSPVLVADHWTGWDPARDTSDGVHPNDAGTVRMAATWLPVVERALALVEGTAPTPGPSPTVTPTPTPTPTATPTPTPTSTSTPTSTPTPTPPAGAACTAVLTVTSRWPGGFVATVRVTSSGTSATSGWQVAVPLPANQVAHAWSATVSGSSSVTFDAVAWNGALAPGAAAELGFQGTGEPPVGAVTCTAR
ncbi:MULTISPECIES: cellulose binding domain-containing protein [Cellulomonas]|uniref:Lysophospholipase L1-like esterase n=1 Tax=Cellulomonas iranensis TaxID=76862 RepID=A0ABU0GF68_9CELL|nr:MULTISPECIES: cellulose binding domain-containing protein [Cellulomonas]MDQ0424007.1 lysophospholipase L1-like esterase [Cellulomonas iranensis]TFH72816.1 cellulose-binding protein [Cellulomonas sp. HD19AZ1]